MTLSVVEGLLAGTTAVLLVAPLLFTDIVTLLLFLVSVMVETLLGLPRLCFYIGSRYFTGTCTSF